MTTEVQTEVVFADAFADGIDLGGRWQLISWGPVFSADSGLVDRVRDGLRVRSPGRNDDTGEPAFVPSGHLGNHLKWVAQLTDLSSAGFPGRDVPADGVLTFRMGLSARVFGAERHPFGDAVTDAGTDFRLGAAVMNAMDFDTGIVFDFWVTEDAIHPFYERIPRPDHDASALAFASVFPAVPRTPGAVHDLALSLDGATGVATWLVDDAVVATVTELGLPDPAATVVLDHGGTPRRVEVRQLLGGFGIMTLMDGGLPPSGIGLVDLGEPYAFPLSFRGGQDAYGQGVELIARDYRIEESRHPADAGSAVPASVPAG